MDTFLSFCSDLILFTAGIFVIALWMALIMVVSVEAWDAIAEKIFGRAPKGLLTPKEDEDA